MHRVIFLMLVLACSLLWSQEKDETQVSPKMQSYLDEFFGADTTKLADSLNYPPNDTAGVVRGAPVVSIGNGLVVDVVLADPELGNSVRIAHKIKTTDGEKYVESLYAYLQDIKVKKGDYVSRGQTIASLGTVGESHLTYRHFEMQGGVKDAVQP